MKHSITRFGKNAALFSLIFGISLALLFLITKADGLLIFGFFHLIPTVIIHGITLLIITGNLIRHPDDYKEHLLVIFMMLLNIPIAIGCAVVVLTYGDV